MSHMQTRHSQPLNFGIVVKSSLNLILKVFALVVCRRGKNGKGRHQKKVNNKDRERDRGRVTVGRRGLGQ